MSSVDLVQERNTLQALLREKLVSNTSNGKEATRIEAAIKQVRETINKAEKNIQVSSQKKVDGVFNFFQAAATAKAASASKAAKAPPILSTSSSPKSNVAAKIAANARKEANRAELAAKAKEDAVKEFANKLIAAKEKARIVTSDIGTINEKEKDKAVRAVTAAEAQKEAAESAARNARRRADAAEAKAIASFVPGAAPGTVSINGTNSSTRPVLREKPRLSATAVAPVAPNQQMIKGSKVSGNFLTSSSAAQLSAPVASKAAAIAQVASKAAAPVASKAISAVKPQDSKWETWMQEWLKKNPITNESKIIRVTKDPTGIFHTDILVRGVDMQKEVVRPGESRLFLVKPVGNTYHIRLINVSSALPSALPGRLMVMSSALPGELPSALPAGLTAASSKLNSKLTGVSSKLNSKLTAASSALPAGLTDMSDIDHVIESLKRIATLINTIPRKNPITGIFDENELAIAKSILPSIKAELEMASPFAETIREARIQKGDGIRNVNTAMKAITKFTALTGALEELIRRSNPSTYVSEAELAKVEAEVEADRRAADAELAALESEVEKSKGGRRKQYTHKRK